MAAKKTILVVGATGQQGGSVVRHLLDSGNFNVRGLTRNTNSDSAQALIKAGVELVPGELSDISTIRKAIRGCDGVFGVTNFWEHFNKEFEHGINLIEAVEAEKIKHLVFSSLPNPRNFGQGELDVPHFELKARVEEQIRKKGLPATIIHAAFYYENFIYFLPPQKQSDGSYSFGFPQGDTPLAAVSAEDIGGIVTPVFENPEKYIGKNLGVVGDDRPAKDYAEIMTQVTGKKIVYNYIPRDVFAGFGFPGAEDLANMFEMNRLYIPNRTDDLNSCLNLYDRMQSFETWALRNKDRLAAVLPE